MSSNIVEKRGTLEAAEIGTARAHQDNGAPPTSKRLERVRALNPLVEPGWDALLQRNPTTCVFHSSAWCRVLQETYGHQPVYFGRFLGQELEEALPIMEVSSWLTGKRGVSLPFSDACPRVTNGPGDGAQLFDAAQQEGLRRGWRYLEFRNTRPPWLGVAPSLSFWSHIVELGGGPEVVFKNFEGAMRRGTRKAEASGLEIEISDSMNAIRQFFVLHCRTRRRHGVPPQPWKFFENIARYVFGGKHGFVVSARLGNRPVAAAVFFHWGREAIYKFGASEDKFKHLRPNNLVMWMAIRKYSEQGFSHLDLGRTSLANEGLRRFKAGFGAREQKINYCRYDLHKKEFVRDTDRSESGISIIFRYFPLPLLRVAGRALYPHLS